MSQRCWDLQVKYYGPEGRINNKMLGCTPHKTLERTSPMLTLEDLKAMKPGVFAQGMVEDNPTGINMANTNKMLRWVAVRGGMHDWVIYCCENHATCTWNYVARAGTKVMGESHIRRLVHCSDEALGMYRR